VLKITVIDTYVGCRAADTAFEIAFSEDGVWRLAHEGRTDSSGNSTLFKQENSFKPGYYELTLFLGEYFKKQEYPLAGRKFVDIVPVRFGIDDASSDVTITVTISPNGYSVWKG